MVQTCVEKRKLKIGALRPGIDTRPALIEQLDWRSRDITQYVVGAGEVDVQFGNVIARANVDIHAVYMRRRCEVAPPPIIGGFVHGVRRYIAVLRANLRA